MTADDSTNGKIPFGVRLVANEVAVSRGGARILHAISFELAPGEAIILRGANGVGKTTLLRALSGFLRCEAGSISLLTPSGARIEDPHVKTLYCGPVNAIKTALTVDENLKFWAALYGVGEDRVKSARAALNLDAYGGRRAGALSTGLARRLGLSRLLLSNRPVWFVDEPTASLDAASIRIFEDLAAAHCARGGSAVIATHDGMTLPGARTITLGAGDGA